MRKALLVGALMMLGGCVTDPPEVKQCESSLLAKLKSPATYKRINVSNIRIADKKAQYQSVEITYDSQNSYGALIRDTERCFYPVENNGSVRTDLPGEITEAVYGKGYFAPGAKLPSVEQHRQQIMDEANSIIANYDAANSNLGEPDNFSAM